MFGMQLMPCVNLQRFSLQVPEESADPEGDTAEVFDFLRGFTTDMLQRFV